MIILATGYDAITGSLDAIDIRGRGGFPLRDAWKDGAMAYLGLLAPGFPNLFVLTGPGSPSVLANMFMSIDQHVELVHRLLDEADRRDACVIEARRDALEAWASRVSEIADSTLMTSGNSWYLGSNIPGKPRQFMPYAGGLNGFIADCDERLARGFEGFVFTGADLLAEAQVFAG